MNDRIKGNIITIAGTVLGMASGFLYWKYVGCLSGTCPLQSNWIIMTAYGALTGGLLGSVAQGFAAREKKS